MITVTYDQEVDMTYIKLNDTPVRQTIIGPGETYNLDLSSKGALVGVEYFGSPGELRKALEDDKYDELWTDLYDFVTYC